MEQLGSNTPSSPRYSRWNHTSPHPQEDTEKPTPIPKKWVVNSTFSKSLCGSLFFTTSKSWMKKLWCFSYLKLQHNLRNFEIGSVGCWHQSSASSKPIKIPSPSPTSAAMAPYLWPTPAGFPFLIFFDVHPHKGARHCSRLTAAQKKLG